MSEPDGRGESARFEERSGPEWLLQAKYRAEDPGRIHYFDPLLLPSSRLGTEGRREDGESEILSAASCFRSYVTKNQKV